MNAQHRRNRSTPALLASLAFAALALTACSAESDPEATVPVLSTMRNTQSASGTTETQSSNRTSGDTYIDQTLNGGAPAWNFPLVFENWTMAPRNDATTLRLDSDAGCSYTATQNPWTGDPKANDRDETQRQADEWKAKLAAETTDPVFTVADSSDVRGIGDSTVTTLRADATYTGADAKPGRSTTWFRTFATGTKPMTMTLEYTCPAEAYNEEDLNQLLENTRLMNVEHPSLD
ncbi:hypothetical protein FRX94_12335 [Corynebacterium canis]|uniref:Lipoprotein n=1 Tax=Corynebacterium canis TaxID=679663 RepID=A0A5C5TV86_9CORY|nr:hypothetical protein [Corynebacterium canis]TWT17507.1 hypothetical protein FRX94_12335 [Corynebacterium canis]WJY76141.1 hypothetical protein CCANI_11660 [Corynebacterium canis]